MKTKILLAGLACLSVVAVAQQSNSEQKPSKSGEVMVRESPSKASTGLRESPSKPSTVRESPSRPSSNLRESPSKRSADQVTAGDLNGDGRADKAAGGQSGSSGTALNTSHANIKGRDLATGQASGKVNVQDLNVMKRTDSSTPAEPKK